MLITRRLSACVCPLRLLILSLPRLLLPLLVSGGLLCKLVAGLQATSIFVSAISITAIALDRYQVIVNPTRQACHPLKTMITLTCIWILALILASPLFYYRTVESISLKSLSESPLVLSCLRELPFPPPSPASPPTTGLFISARDCLCT